MAKGKQLVTNPCFSPPCGVGNSVENIKKLMYSATYWVFGLVMDFMEVKL